MARTEPRRAPTGTLLTALGFGPALERTYQVVRRRSGQRLEWVAAALSTTPEDLLAELEPLAEMGLVRLEGDCLLVEPPAEALARLLVAKAESATQAHAELAVLAHAVPVLVAAATRPDEDAHELVGPIDGEVSRGGDARSLIVALLQQSQGDLCWLRPDQWRAGREAGMREAIRQLTASGRRSRAIYPMRVLREAPEVVQLRAEAGEEVRLLADVPTRMFVIGRTHAVLPEPLGFVDEPRTLVRQQGIVEALLLLFELMWERATPLPEPDTPLAPADERRFLLQQLAVGEHDEQIARKLGLSLRTVRRRVADLMTELGADSRFQAGVEAARRGWL